MSWTAPPDAPCVQIRRRYGDREAARIFTPERRDIITAEPVPTDNGAEALAACARCKHWAPCVATSVARNDRFGITGGAGGGRRRALRRAWDTPAWPDALAAHGRNLHGEPAQPGDDDLLRPGGDDRTCGLRGSFATGCRCDPCSFSAGTSGALAATGKGRNLAAAAAAWLVAS